jgi:hypothetical protein
VLCRDPLAMVLAAAASSRRHRVISARKTPDKAVGDRENDRPDRKQY